MPRLGQGSLNNIDNQDGGKDKQTRRGCLLPGRCLMDCARSRKVVAGHEATKNEEGEMDTKLLSVSVSASVDTICKPKACPHETKRNETKRANKDRD